MSETISNEPSGSEVLSVDTTELIAKSGRELNGIVMEQGRGVASYQ